MDTITRNDLLSAYTDMIKRIMRRNRLLLYALRLEQEDVFQELAIAALMAIDTFDPNRSNSMDAHVWMKLQYAVLTIKQRYRPAGLTGLQGIRPCLCSVEFEEELGHPLAASTVEDVQDSNNLQQALAMLNPAECIAVIRYLDGNSFKHAKEKKVFATALDKLKEYYTEACAVTA